MAKIKAFTLIEILIASSIFMVVAISSAAAFAMVKKSNNKTEDLRIANDCARQVEDFIKNEVRSASSGEKIKGLKYSGGVYSGITIPPNGGAYPGFVSFRENEVRAVIRESQTDRNDYLFIKASTELQLLDDLKNSPSANKPSLLNSMDCQAEIPSSSTSANIFKITPLGISGTKPNGFSVSVNDVFYRVINLGSTMQKVDQSYSAMAVEAVNIQKLIW